MVVVGSLGGLSLRRLMEVRGIKSRGPSLLPMAGRSIARPNLRRPWWRMKTAHRRPNDRRMMTSAIFICDLFVVTRSRETGIRSFGVNPAARKPVMDQRHDWAVESAIAVMAVCATMGQLRVKAYSPKHSPTLSVSPPGDSRSGLCATAP